jgi:putative ABC transport system substrate-binding protein
MRRRDVIAALGATMVWPRPVRAQQPRLPVAGWLNGGAVETSTENTDAFRKGLAESGFVEGRNVAIEYRFANSEIHRLPELAADLVRHRVAVIVASSISAALAAQAATKTIPIVFRTGADPVQARLVASLNRPGGNVTGINDMSLELGAKRLGLLNVLVPQAKRIAVLVDPTSTVGEAYFKDAQTAATTIGKGVEVYHASTNDEIDAAFEAILQKLPDALMVSPDVVFSERRVQVVTLASRHGLPAIYTAREYPQVGGLMSYGANLPDASRLAGTYAGRILKGSKPAELPVMRATKFEFVINMQTAKSLGIDVPPNLLALADEAIE